MAEPVLLLTASQVPDAIGLNYRMSRREFHQVWTGKKAEPVADNYLQNMFDYGNDMEQSTFEEFKRVTGIDAVRNSTRYTLGRLGATPDAIAGTWIPIELKSVQAANFYPHNGPKPAHLAQLLTQCHCIGAPYGLLFYHRASTGDYSLYKVAYGQERFEQSIGSWLNEFFGFRDSVPNMPRGEAQRRSDTLYKFLVSAKQHVRDTALSVD